jgi:hypothetical protein
MVMEESRKNKFNRGWRAELVSALKEISEIGIRRTSFKAARRYL